MIGMTQTPDATESVVTLELRDNVAVLTLDDGNVNAMSYALLSTARAAFADAVSVTVRTAETAGGDTAELAARLDEAVRRLVSVTATMFSSGDIDAARANSVAYLEAFGHIVVAWMWLQQVVVCHGRDGDFYDGKRQAARFFFRYELPKTASQLDLLESLDRTTLDMGDSWF